MEAHLCALVGPDVAFALPIRSPLPVRPLVVLIAYVIVVVPVVLVSLAIPDALPDAPQEVEPM